MLVVQALAGVLLQMHALDADLDGGAVLHVEEDHALADDGVLILRDLVALRQVGIEVVLPVEDGIEVDLSLQPEAGADRLAHAFLVDDGEHARHGGVHQRDVALGAPPNSVEAPENSLELDETCAWTSMPITTSQELVAPSMRLFCLVSAVMAASLVPYTLPLPSQTPWPSGKRRPSHLEHHKIGKTRTRDLRQMAALSRLKSAAAMPP